MHPTSSPSMTRRRPASAPLKSHVPYEKYLPDEKHEDLTDGPKGTSTGKSLSETLIFASTNPQYDDRVFIELQVQYIKIPSSEHCEKMLCTEVVFDIQNN